MSLTHSEQTKMLSKIVRPSLTRRLRPHMSHFILSTGIGDELSDFPNNQCIMVVI